jgi:hypothetical protein
MPARKTPFHSASVLSLSGPQRLLIAGLLIAFIWAALAWALC